MKKLVLGMLLSFAFAAPAFAHSGEAIAHVNEEALAAEGVIVVTGKPEAVLARIIDVNGWPVLFRDVVSAKPAKNGIGYAINLATFGHPHDFFIAREADRIRLYLDDPDHPRDTIALAYQVEAFDQEHTLIRTSVSFRPLGPAAMVPRGILARKLEKKVRQDLEDLRKALEPLS